MIRRVKTCSKYTVDAGWSSRCSRQKGFLRQGQVLMLPAIAAPGAVTGMLHSVNGCSVLPRESEIKRLYYVEIAVETNVNWFA